MSNKYFREREHKSITIYYGTRPRTKLDIALRKSERIQPNMESELEDLIKKVTMLDKIFK